jgi:hypothetical protein
MRVMTTRHHQIGKGPRRYLAGLLLATLCATAAWSQNAPEPGLELFTVSRGDRIYATIQAPPGFRVEFEDHRSPHDAWLESLSIAEVPGDENFKRITNIRVLLLGAYHDCYIEIFYPHVFRYDLQSPSSVRGLGDWRYDEFTLSPNDHVIHGFTYDEGSRWIIEASDIQVQWIPK